MLPPQSAKRPTICKPIARRNAAGGVLQAKRLLRKKNGSVPSVRPRNRVHSAFYAIYFLVIGKNLYSFPCLTAATIELLAMASPQRSQLATILCIDDDRDTLEVRRNVLRSWGFTVLTASGGIDALEILASGAVVDLVILNFMMPGMDGDHVAETFKTNFPHLPIIAVSAVQLPPRMLDLV